MKDIFGIEVEPGDILQRIIGGGVSPCIYIKKTTKSNQILRKYCTYKWNPVDRKYEITSETHKVFSSKANFINCSKLGIPIPEQDELINEYNKFLTKKKNVKMVDPKLV